MRSWAALVCALVLSPPLAAQQAYDNACDPDVEPRGVCEILYTYYSAGIAPMPGDADRAAELNNAIIAHEQTGCIAGQTRLCKQWLYRMIETPELDPAAGQIGLDTVRSAIEAACLSEGGSQRNCFGSARRFLSTGPDESVKLVAATLLRLEADFNNGEANACPARLRRLTHGQADLKLRCVTKACALDDAASCYDVGRAVYRAYSKAPSADLLKPVTEAYRKSCDLSYTAA